MIHIQRLVLLMALSGVATLVQAAGTVAAVQQEIDRTVWQPFKCAFEAMDGRALNALYAERVLRITPNGIDTKSAFKSFNETRFDESKGRGEQTTLDFWLESRATDPQTSYEVGLFRLGSIRAVGDVQYYYGQFHILLRKQRGGWKIVQDWDTGAIAGRPINAEDFARGTAIQTSCH